MNKHTKLKILHIVHFPFLFIWFGLFLIPSSVWNGRIEFQFWYALTLAIGQYVWGMIVFKKFASICPLTTWMQELRGYDRQDPLNYEHSYIQEQLGMMNIPIGKKALGTILQISFVAILLQYATLYF